LEGQSFFLKGDIEKGFGLSKKNPETLVAGRKPGSVRPAVINENIQRAMKRKLLSPTTTAKQIKKTIPCLANVTMRAIQHVSLKKLKLSSTVMANKSILTQRMKEHRLEFAHQYNNRGVGGLETSQVLTSVTLS
jgi:hypothetical protein